MENNEICDVLRELPPELLKNLNVKNFNGRMDEIKAETSKSVEREGMGTDKPKKIKALKKIQSNIANIICLMEGAEIIGENKSGLIIIEEAENFYNELHFKNGDDGEFMDIKYAIANLRKIAKAIDKTLPLVASDFPSKLNKTALKNAAGQICILLREHGLKVTAYRNGLACKLISNVMTFAKCEKSVDSYRGAVQIFLNNEKQ